MSKAITCSEEQRISSFLLQTYGPLLGREELAKVLGFASEEGLERYIQRGHLQLELVRMPSRRGIFALATDVAAYLIRSRSGSAAGRKEREASSN